MSKLFLVAILGITLLLIIGVFIFAGNRKVNLLAFVANTFQVLLARNNFKGQEELVYFPETKEEAKDEKESNGLVEEETKEGSDLNPDLSLDEITEEIDEISEKIDLLNQEVEEFLAQNAKKEEIAEKPEEKDEQELKKEDKKEELSQEEIENEEKVPKEETILCQKGSQNPFQAKVIFNEISWMGTIEDWRNEWFELKNISNSDISLKNWQILDKDQEIKIIFEENDKILAGQFFLLERTNDDSVPNITADKIYSGNLNDEDETLYLFDENCQLQDEILANPNWPAGDKIEKRTMERKTDFVWQSSLSKGGTPKTENSFGYSVISGGGGSAPAPSYPKILISEIMILPIEQRFIELFNPNNYDVNLTGWYIQRKTKTGTSWSSLVSSTQFEGKIIPANSYFIITRSIIENSDILLEDLTLTEDNAILVKNPDREIVDEVGWGESLDFETSPALNPLSDKTLGRKFNEENQAYQDTDNNSDDFEIQDPSLKSENQSPIIPEPVLEDNVPPQVAFDLISSLQTNSSFSISWVGQDFAPEGVTPSGIDGFLLRYSEDKENWTFWPSETEYTQETQYLFKGENGKIYYFQIKVKDKDRNESDWSEILIEINTRPIVINEVYYDVDEKEAGEKKEEEGDNEWIEIYNLANWPINISGWIIEDNGGISKQKIIPDSPDVPAKGFAVITPFESTWLYWTIPDTIVKITLDTKIGSYGLSNEGDRVILREPAGKEIDAMSYEDDITIFELPISAKEGESLSRKTVGYDTDTADDWQVLDVPTPGQ